MNDTEQVTLSYCQNCQKVWDDHELEGISHLHQRVAPGESFPSGECPDRECGALCQPLEDDYITVCPVKDCDGDIKLRSFSANCDIPVEAGGWSYHDGPLDSSDEKFTCTECSKDVPGEWVFGKLSRAAAEKEMKP